ncbi:MAG: hypothetical protein JWR16_791 [Nevskia sp.]|nr:hypothetical protein [Nevskia sp.]
MIDNATAIARLELSKRALQAQCNSASGARLLQLMSAIHLIADEVGQLEVSTLQDAPYIPQTDAFKQQTADAKAFVA